MSFIYAFPGMSRFVQKINHSEFVLEILTQRFQTFSWIKTVNKYLPASLTSFYAPTALRRAGHILFCRRLVGRFNNFSLNWSTDPMINAFLQKRIPVFGASVGKRSRSKWLLLRIPFPHNSFSFNWPKAFKFIGWLYQLSIIIVPTDRIPFVL